MTSAVIDLSRKRCQLVATHGKRFSKEKASVGVGGALGALALRAAGDNEVSNEMGMHNGGWVFT